MFYRAGLRGGFGFGADDCAVGVELLVELAEPVPNLALLSFLVGVGLGGSGELGARVVEVLSVNNSPTHESR